MSGLGRLFGGRRADREARQAEERVRREQEEADRREMERLAAVPFWTDSHCHLQHLETDDDVRQVLSRAREAGTRRLVIVGTDVPSSRRAVDIATSVHLDGPVPIESWATVGLHPHDSRLGTRDLVAFASELAGAPGGFAGARVAAIGETGLDFHYEHSPWEVQRRAFAEQIRLAHEHRLALVIHTREAWNDTFEILQSEGVPERTVFHCFTGGPAEAERCLAIGAYLSFSGIVTFGNAGELREAVKATPLDRILVETDAPFLTPVPHRGKTNEPHFVSLVGEAVAEQKGEDPATVAKATSANASVVFNLH